MLTLPPQVGNFYWYRNREDDELRLCEIIHEEESSCYSDKPIMVYKSRSEYDDWTYWPDGKAKTGPKEKDYIAILVKDGPMMDNSKELEEIRNQREAMLQRLREISAC